MKTTDKVQLIKDLTEYLNSSIANFDCIPNMDEVIAKIESLNTPVNNSLFTVAVDEESDFIEDKSFDFELDALNFMLTLEDGDYVIQEWLIDSEDEESMEPVADTWFRVTDRSAKRI